MIDALLLAALVIALVAAYVLQRRSRREIASLQLEQAQLQRDRDVESLHAAQAGAKLDALGLAVLEVLVIVDRDLRVTYATPGARALFETGTQTIGRSLVEFSRSAELDQLAADAFASGPAASGSRDELDRIIPISGRPFRVRAAAFEGGVVLALSDVSELQQLGRARRDFVANISHELRTPLTSIRLALDDLLRGGLRSPDETQAKLHSIQVEVEALQQMAQELLDLAQIESGRIPVRLVPTDIERLVGDTVERFSALAARKRETVTVEVASGLAALSDAGLVGRALGNLLHNAIKFAPPEGHVSVRARRLEGDILIEVADNGPGIPGEDLPRVFERFFRGDRSRAGGGTGLGLAIARHVVEAHGGRIWAESDGIPGHGATFRFTLPAADDPG
jgi:two-component system phosphate regulon sensor histidine kinase PhoR